MSLYVVPVQHCFRITLTDYVRPKPSIPADWDETDPESGRPKGSIALSALIDGLDHQQLQLLNAIKSRNNVSGGELVEMYWKEVREQCIGEEDAESEETKSGTKGKSQAGK